MSLIVQKFGGTSVADAEKIRAAARRALRAQQQGAQVVMVVSAMGHQTDILVDLAAQVCEDAPAREMDMLLSTGEQVSVALMAMAIHDLGGQAVSLTGAQMEIRTDSAHGKARIRSIGADRIRAHLDAGRIVIAAGFQGIDENLNITTLGRGGSDTTAVALAAVLGADMCEIYTDVDGVFTTDPRIEPAARKMDCVSHDEILELASLGAGVMHSRSIEFGKKFNVPIHVRNSGVFTDVPGTIIGPLSEAADRAVSGAALTKNEAQLTIAGVPDKPGVSLALLESLSAANLSVDMIVQSRGADGRANISFTVLDTELNAAKKAAREAAAAVGAREVRVGEPVSKVSVVGLGMASQPGVARRMFRALADAGINIHAISTSTIKVSCLVAREQGQEALRVVHREFELGKTPSSPATIEDSLAAAKEAKAADAEAVIARLQAMEELRIDGCEIDESQALLSLRSVPDTPGVAAQIFEAIAARDVMVDLIVQSIGEDGLTSVGITVPQKDAKAAADIVAEVAEKIGGEVSLDPGVAILSVTGVGVRSHTGVGTRIFRALSAAGINVEMIGTSEVRVSVVIGGEHGAKALAATEKAFADVIR
ncbi:aspartate kinase [Botrimarina mediterranea]|uniref:aspartate kinase n=1 Tax=Botrimarina mediterranea TaxID=2528022 RepID=A0A518K468_9BACT|nr:aspartate kinase [Botrimarina mediterranea]QDV72591.1 Aspartokinase [Botrimarina mediterranea]QDV77163.1 Aspartokinase [Planctomycetes bacterium K2D]